MRPAYSAPLVLNLQHYHWYSATHSPSSEGVAIVELTTACKRGSNLS